VSPNVFVVKSMYPTSCDVVSFLRTWRRFRYISTCFDVNDTDLRDKRRWKT